MKKKLMAAVLLMGCNYNTAFGAEGITKAVASCDDGYNVTIIDNGGDESNIKYFVFKNKDLVAQGQGLPMTNNRTADGLQVTNIGIPAIKRVISSAKGNKFFSYTYIIEYPVTERQKKINKQKVSLLVNSDLFTQGKDEVLRKCSQVISRSN